MGHYDSDMEKALMQFKNSTVTASPVNKVVFFQDGSRICGGTDDLNDGIMAAGELAGKGLLFKQAKASSMAGADMGEIRNPNVTLYVSINDRDRFVKEYPDARVVTGTMRNYAPASIRDNSQSR